MISDLEHNLLPAATTSAQCTVESVDTYRTDPCNAVTAPAAPPSSVTSVASLFKSPAVVPSPSSPHPVPILSNSVSPAVSSAGHSSSGLWALGSGLSLHPVRDVRAYLARPERKPQPHFAFEEPLFVTLTADIKGELRALLGLQPGGGAFGTVLRLVKARSSVQSACSFTCALQMYSRWSWTTKRFRARFDLWCAKQDWVVLVNRAKAGALWQVRDDGLPHEFLVYCAQRLARYRRDDAKRQALLAIVRQWKTGRNERGELEPIPGYGYWQDWARKAGRPLPQDPPVPTGWSYSNILRQIEAANLFTRSTRALLQEGTAAARAFLPYTLGTRAGLRFMEEIVFDDVKTDWRVFDPESGQVCDLWLLIARDKATNIVLGFGMRPARVREDGSQEHLKLRDMKQLLGWLLERFGLPPYTVHFRFERGTATIGEATAAAMAELLGPGRVACHWTGMIGGTSAVGYREKRVGNARGKASLESTNRLGHTIGALNPGQTGPIYTRRSQDLAGREKEAVEAWQLAQLLPEHLRGSVQYPLLTLAQARAELCRIFAVQNNRTEHELEGFETILEWYDEQAGKWMPQHSAPAVEGLKVRSRKESPIERAARLSAGLRWTPVSPEAVAAFYQHTQREVTVKDSGEIHMRHDGTDYTFRNPGPALVPGTKLLAYHHPEDPRFLHLTDGRGTFIGTWLRRERAADPHALSEAIEYAAQALKAARQHAEQLAAPERAELDAMREHNASLMQYADFVPAHTLNHQPSTLNSVGTPAAAAIASTTATRADAKRAAKQRDAETEDARETLRKSML